MQRVRYSGGVAGLLLTVLLAGCSLNIGQPAEVPTAPPAATAVPAATAAPAATTAPESSATAAPVAAATTLGPAIVKGDFKYTNDFVFTYYVENAVGLVDMYGFVTRDNQWKLPLESQQLGPMELDPATTSGTFQLALPVAPRGQFVDVDNNGKKDTGVQVFALSWWPNGEGGPFWERDENQLGWPSYLASTVNDPENHQEVTGGKLIVWAPDANQQFPTGFGADGKLFTADDPVAPLPAGYSLVDLDSQPFKLSQDTELAMTLYEPVDAAIKDYANLSYTEAFKQMFDKIREEYAFNGIAGKAPDWDALYTELAPRVEAAERDKDAKAFYLAIADFTNAFHDGHVGVGSQIGSQIFAEETAGGYGFALRELDDGRTIVTYVTPGASAEKAGMTVGATVSEFNGKPIKDAISAVKPFGGPFSTDHNLRYQQQRYLLRAPLGSKANVTFTNPGQSVKTAELETTDERQSFGVTSLARGASTSGLPIDYRVLDSGIGYIKINTFYDDLNLLVRLYERALGQFEQAGLPGVIIDLRQNGGGSPLGLASFLTTNTIELGQDESYSSKTGKFEQEGAPSTIEPSTRQYHFDKLALLVGPACASACESAAYGFSKVPGMTVVGQYPTAGAFGDVARGQYKLPDGISLQVPTGRRVLPDGSIFIEGKGVPPTLRVPVDEQTVTSTNDVVLQAAEKAVLGQ